MKIRWFIASLFIVAMLMGIMLTVTADTSPVIVTIKGNTVNTTYDGTSHSAAGYTVVSISDARYTENDFSFSGTAEVSAIDAGDHPMGLTPAMFTNISTGAFPNVTFKVTDGSLTITPRPVSVTVIAEIINQVYDGENHTADVTEIVCDDDLFDASKVVFAHKPVSSIDVINTTSNGYTAGDFRYDDKNFAATFMVNDGSLTITPMTLILRTETGSWTYDGSAHSLPTVHFDQGKLCKRDGTCSADVTVTDVTGLNGETNAITLSLREGASGNYSILLDEGDLYVTPLEIAVTITGNTVSETYDGTEKTASGYTWTWAPVDPDMTVDDDLYTAGDFTFSGSAQAAGTIVNRVAADDPVEAYVMGIQAGQFANTNDNFAASFTLAKDGSLIIEPAEYWIETDAVSITYDGTPRTLTAGGTVKGLVNNETASVATTGSQTGIGESSNTYGDITWGTADEINYRHNTAKDVIGLLAITPVTREIIVTIRGNTGTATYDGNTHSASGYSVVSISDPLYTLNDFSFSGTAKVTAINAGDHPMGLTPTMFTNTNTGTFTNVTFAVTDGHLMIDPLPYWVVTLDGEKTYDGTALTAGASVEGLLGSETATVTVTGAQTAAGSSDNCYSGVVWNTALEQNYSHDETRDRIGTLTVNAREITVTVTAEVIDLVYDGENHTADVTDITCDDTLFDSSKVIFAHKPVSGIDVMSTTSNGYTADDFRYDDKNFVATFTVNNGSLTITPKDVTLSTESGSWVYDGTAHSLPTVHFDKGELYERDGTCSADVTITDAGKTGNAITLNLKEGAESNYSVTVNEGTLSVTPLEIAVTVTGNTVNATYDGTKKTVRGYTWTWAPFDPDMKVDDDLYTAGDFTFDGNALIEEISVKRAAAEDPVGAYVMCLSADRFTNTNKNFEAVFTLAKDGSLTIEPAVYWIETGDASKPCDGEPLTAGGVVKGLVNGETATVETTGSQTEPGVSSNTYGDITWGTAHEINYTHNADNDVIGTLTVINVYTVTVNYWKENIGGEKAYETFEKKYTDGDPFYVESPDIYGYSTDTAAISGTTDKDLTFDVIYQRDHFSLTIRYIFKDGAKPFWVHRERLYVGQSFDVASPKLEGCTPDREAVRGVMRYRHLAFTVVYEANGIDLVTDSMQQVIILSGDGHTGLSFIAFDGESPTVGGKEVRQAIALCLNKYELAAEYVNRYGIAEDVYYGIDRWMVRRLNGTMPVPEGENDRENPEKAVKLLEDAGWTLNENGTAYTGAEGEVRAMEKDGKLIPLSIKLCCAEEDQIADYLDAAFVQPLARTGIRLTVETVSRNDLLNGYYHRDGRDWDMILLTADFEALYDPYAGSAFTKNGPAAAK